MAANMIRVNTSSLETDANSVATYIKQIKTAMQKLEEAKMRLDASYDGQASEAFKKAFNDDMNQLRTFISNLEKMNTFERTAKQKYVGCENRVSGMISAIKV